MPYYFILFPLIGCAIGWLTNLLAIKFLFWPRRPVGLGRFTVQGVLPRRRRELAAAVGQVIATELLSHQQIAAALNAPEIRTGMAEFAGNAAANRLASHPLLLAVPRALRSKLAEFAAKVVEKEVDDILARGGSEMATQVMSAVNLAGLVEERLDAMDWDYMEKIVYTVAGRELKLIEVLGGILGAVVGLAQALIVTLI